GSEQRVGHPRGSRIRLLEGDVVAALGIARIRATVGDRVRIRRKDEERSDNSGSEDDLTHDGEASGARRARGSADIVAAKKMFPSFTRRYKEECTQTAGIGAD